MNYNFLIIGGDKRIRALAKSLKQDGHEVKTYANKVEEIEEINTKEELYMDNSEIIISSVPLSKDGININTPLSEKTITIDEFKKISKNKKVI